MLSPRKSPEKEDHKKCLQQASEYRCVRLREQTKLRHKETENRSSVKQHHFLQPEQLHSKSVTEKTKKEAKSSQEQEFSKHDQKEEA